MFRYTTVSSYESGAINWNKTKLISTLAPYDVSPAYWYNGEPCLPEPRWLNDIDYKFEPAIGRIVGLADGPDGYLYASDVLNGIIWKTDISHDWPDETREWIYVFSTGGDSVWNIAYDQTSFPVPVLWGRVRDSVNGNKIVAYEVESGSPVNCPGPPPGGVCCYPDGFCDVTLEANCGGGLWYGGIYSCAESKPCQWGVCCLPDGSCQLTTRIDCVRNKGGQFHPEYTYCDPDRCPSTGVCCKADSCAILTEADCLLWGGNWYPSAGGCGTFDCAEACTPAPAGMAGWWPLEHSLGSGAQADIVSSRHCREIGNVMAVSGMVGDALRFSTANDYLETVSGDWVHLGTRDLSIDCWIRSSTTSDDIHTIVDHRGAPFHGSGYGAGFSLYLLGGGRLGFQLADQVSHTNWVAAGPDLRDGDWHHVAVTVDRDQTTGGRMWVDGVKVLQFNPTGRSGSISNSGPLRIGQRNDSPLLAFDGDIDEVEVFGRALRENEISAIYEAGGTGKCKENCSVPPIVAKCYNKPTVNTHLTICNHTAADQTYAWSIVGLWAGDTPYNVDGVWADFAPRESGDDVVMVPAGKCVTIPISITPNVYISAGKKMGYRVGVVSSTGDYCSCDGGVTATDWWLCSGINYGVATIAANFRQLFAFPLFNTSSAPETLSYQISAAPANLDTQRYLVSLNGQTPGTNVSGSVVLPPLSSTSISVTASFTAPEPFMLHNLMLKCDLDCDGLMDEFGCVQLKSIPHTKAVDWPNIKQEKKPEGFPYRSSEQAAEFGLRQNVPNPFNPTTTISFTLSQRVRATLSVYSIEGMLVKQLVDDVLDPGLKQFTWDGKDSRGNSVSSGVYFYRLTAGERTVTKKLVILR